MSVRIMRFDSERNLTDYLDSLNDLGLEPDVATMDSSGIAALVCLQAPGGDGWGIAYYRTTEEDGSIQGEFDTGWVRPARTVPDCGRAVGWEPAWPVFGLVNVLDGGA